MKFLKDDLINYRLDRAFETFGEAKVLAKNAFWNATANRLYYSCFYAINALFVKEGIVTKTHTGAKNQFHLNFIKTNLIDRKYGYLYSKLFSLRNTGDYEDFIIYDQKTIEPLFMQVEDFLKTIKSNIESDEP